MSSGHILARTYTSLKAARAPSSTQLPVEHYLMEDLERVPNPASSVDGTTVGIDVEAAVREGTLTAEQGLGVLHIYTLGCHSGASVID